MSLSNQQAGECLRVTLLKDLSALDLLNEDLEVQASEWLPRLPPAASQISITKNPSLPQPTCMLQVSLLCKHSITIPIIVSIVGQ